MNDDFPWDPAYSAFFGGTGSVVTVVIYILAVVALWRIFTKAGYAGVLALIPIVNVIIVVKIAGYSGWLTLLYLVPIVGFIFGLFVALRLGDKFGKGGLFSFFLLWLFPIIGYYILGFGSARYNRPPE